MSFNGHELINVGRPYTLPWILAWISHVASGSFVRQLDMREEHLRWTHRGEGEIVTQGVLEAGIDTCPCPPCLSSGSESTRLLTGLSLAQPSSRAPPIELSPPRPAPTRPCPPLP